MKESGATASFREAIATLTVHCAWSEFTRCNFEKELDRSKSERNFTKEACDIEKAHFF